MNRQKTKEIIDKSRTILFYDMDDLVFDLESTNKIKYLDTISKDEKIKNG